MVSLLHKIKDRIKVYEDSARAIDSGDKVKESKLNLQ